MRLGARPVEESHDPAAIPALIAATSVIDRLPLDRVRSEGYGFLVEMTC